MLKAATEWTTSSTGSAAACSSNRNPSGPSRAGRDGLLRLGFERRAHATTLRHCRYTLPLQVLSPLAFDDGTCYLLLLNPTGGVLGGDRLRTEVSLAENSAVCLSTPCATRIYRTSGLPAEMNTVLRLASGATLEYLPDHVIPHAGSILRQSLRIEMEQGSRGIFLDAFSSGRVALDEHWRFQEFDSRTEVSLRGKLICLSRTKIEGAAAAGGAFTPGSAFQFQREKALVASDPPLPSPATFGRMSDYSYCASLLIVADNFPDWRRVVASLTAEIDSLPGVLGGVSLITEAGCSVRYVTRTAIDLQEATRRLWTVARRQVLNLPPLDLRKY